MKKLLALAISGVIAAAFSMSAMAENEPVNIVKGTCVQDGNISEFVKAGAQAITLKGEEMLKDAQTLDDDQDSSGVAYLMYDDKYLYLGAQVTDESILFNKGGADVWNQDCIELWVDGYQYGISVDGDTNEPYVHDWNGSGVNGVNFFKAVDKGYVMEAKFAVGELGNSGVSIAAGKSFQIAVGIDDADADAREAQLYFPTSWVHSSPDTFATATCK